jgi:(1->4)-alpha-D-glucan 1-alpha-D-glucosylmutase
MSDALERLAADAVRTAAERRRPPAATYRLQMHAGFPIPAAAGVTAYLDALGVSHAYTSSLLAAKPGSTHGYDVADHARLNPELGTDADLAGWAADLRDRGMGLILDTVPNHMSVAGPNQWWEDVLENGPSSPYAGFFDIAWHDHPRERLHGKVLLPILGEPFGAAVDAGRFVPGFDGGAFYLELYGRRLPVDPRTYGAFLAPAVETARAEVGPDDPGVLELQSILTAVRHLPPRREPDPGRVAEGRAEAAVVKRRLADLAAAQPAVHAHVLRAVREIAGTPGDRASFARLDELIEAQAYRPCFWRVASDEINYRRFFDINDLAALSTEREEVFAATHARLLGWLADGTADGLRIDHPDGLFDPKGYLDRLQEYYLLALAKHLHAARPEDYDGLAWADAEGPLRERFAAAAEDRPLYVVVEKILGHGERLPDNWAADGTTGYEFLNAVNGLFVDPAGEGPLSEVYERFAGLDEPFEEIVYRNKQLILRSALSSELHMLAHQLDRLAQAERWSRDFTLNGLRHALREVIASFPVYRTYLNDGISDVERVQLLRAIAKARRRNPTLGRAVFEFIRDTLLLKDPPSGPASDEYRAAQRRFAGKFEQVTAPVTAKGLEDTAFYQFNRLLSLNEVGGEPGRFGWTPAKLHEFLAERAARTPGGLSPLATHDTKRGEDVRARLNVLSEIPEEWAAAVARWAELNRRHKGTTEDEGPDAPDGNEEYLIYQTLVGAWPGGGDDALPAFAERVRQYLQKAMREAKVHTSWINPDDGYEAAVERFVTRLLDPAESGEFLADLRRFVPRVARLGRFNSLAQTLLRCTAPGVPDTYQGTELWDFSLVDPDNRRPVDYDARRKLLADLDRRAETGPAALARDLLADLDAGGAKLFTVARALRFRRANPDLLGPGGYLPLTAAGERAAHLFAFLRHAGGAAAVVAVPRLVGRLLAGSDDAPVGPAVWADTHLELPEPYRGRRWVSVLTGEPVGGDVLPAADLFADFPVALLVAE